MPNLVVRINDAEMAALEAAASRAGYKSKSEYVRKTLALREQGGDTAERLQALEDDRDLLDRRLSRLEEMAGL